ncbi:AraC family transcriptional regulator [Carboxylicivirga sp. M1479]|uniref:AraC family transcriptional regulator n=1 Tax=Carboxylicivirga sp. M1479 TaxID=2594476 RepID=UPI0011776043|nr:AraC family transcriptional regulator [Carboxylicivirga sp. M1479]TRX70239.1 helix-turn-helix domain-containing protein [Carboxylicivirga sp. M1479]
MKAQKEYLSANIMHSFRVKHTILPYMDSAWHYHPDYELIYMVKGKGKRFIGDSVDDFVAGDLVFMGPNLPHVYKSDEIHYQGNDDVQTEVIVIQFKHNVFGDVFFNLPELKDINKVLSNSLKGIKISGRTKDKVVSEMWRIVNLNGVMRISSLLNILHLLTDSEDLSTVIKGVYKKNFSDKNSEKLGKVFEYTLHNFKKNIQLDEIATIANMSKTAFCRFFKVKTTKTFHQYLTDIRIGHACELLIDSDLTMSQISNQCGFNSQSLFNRQFKAIKGETPREFYARYKNI